MNAIGVMGGSGLYDLEGLDQIEEVCLETPFGKPSDAFVRGTLKGQTLVFLARHGRGHRLQPSEINFRANIFGFKMLGVKWLVSISAVGSLREQIRPGDLVFPDQFIDFTKKRESTFFGQGIVGHISLAEPVANDLLDHFAAAAETLGLRIHRGGTYICIEGPQFSTRAESHLFRQWGADIIGMTNMPEAKLAREAGISYVTMALATDYDCWHESEEAVTVEKILEIMRGNIHNAKKTLALAVERFPRTGLKTCDGVLAGAILTDSKAIPHERRKELELIFGGDGGE